MTFGSEAFFIRLRAGVEAGDLHIYYELDSTVDRAVRARVRGKVGAADVDDVIQEIKLTVWKRLATYLQQSQGHAPAQRAAWLKMIADSRIADYYRKHYLRQEAPIPPALGDKAPQKTTAPVWQRREIHMEDGPARELTEASPEEVLVQQVERRMNRQKCERLIAYICTRNIAPDRIIATLYNAVVFPLAAGRQSGGPQALMEALAGKSLYALRTRLSLDINMVLGGDIPEEIYKGLDEKLLRMADEDVTFVMDAREITLITSSVRKTARGHRHYILGGGKDE